MRADILEEIGEPLGLKIDDKLNLKTIGKNQKISLSNSKSEVWVIQTDEELVIARDTNKFISE